jgi:hypothetical protein
MLPSMDGKVTVKGIDANVNVGTKEILSNLKIGFLGYAEAGKGDCTLGLDVNYVNLDASDDDLRTSANVTQLSAKPMLFYRISKNFELLAGARYNKIEVGLESLAPSIDGTIREQDWVDPIVGFRMSAPFNPSTAFSFEPLITAQRLLCSHRARSSTTRFAELLLVQPLAPQSTSVKQRVVPSRECALISSTTASGSTAQKRTDRQLSGGSARLSGRSRGLEHRIEVAKARIVAPSITAG